MGFIRWIFRGLASGRENDVRKRSEADDQNDQHDHADYINRPFLFALVELEHLLEIDFLVFFSVFTHGGKHYNGG